MRFGTALLVLVTLSAPASASADAIPWRDAERHVGRVVLIEGFVHRAVRDGRRVTLVFDPDDPRALRVTLVIPIVTDLPPEPERLYHDRRVRVRGRVVRTAGHLDLVVTDPDRITVVGLATLDPPDDDGSPGDAAPAPATEVPPTLPSPSAVDAACARRRAARDTARRDALAAAEALRACLASGRSGCRAAADAVAPPVARLDWLEQDLRARCPAD